MAILVDPYREEARADMLDRIAHGDATSWFNQLGAARLGADRGAAP